MRSWEKDLVRFIEVKYVLNKGKLQKKLIRIGDMHLMRTIPFKVVLKRKKDS